MRATTWMLWASALLCHACVLQRADQERTPNPAAGLYTPESQLGAGDPSDLLPSIGALGDRCVRPPGGGEAAVVTPGELELNYRTQTINGQYAPANATAVWIESADDAYVATLEVNASLRLPGLRHYRMRACQGQRGPDVTTSASLEDHQEPHEGVSWSGRDFAGNPMPDGEYRLYIEITETDKADGDCVDFTFVKGPQPFTQELAVDADGALLDGSISWTLEGATPGFPFPVADAGTN